MRDIIRKHVSERERVCTIVHNKKTHMCTIGHRLSRMMQGICQDWDCYRIIPKHRAALAMQELFHNASQKVYQSRNKKSCQHRQLRTVLNTGVGRIRKQIRISIRTVICTVMRTGIRKSIRGTIRGTIRNFLRNKIRTHIRIILRTAIRTSGDGPPPGWSDFPAHTRAVYQRRGKESTPGAG